MLLILPGLALVLFFTIARRHRFGRREAVLVTALIGGIAVVLLTEGLSIVHALTQTGLAIGWGLVIIAAGVVLRRQKRRTPDSHEANTEISSLSRIILATCACLATILFIVALTAPPNTWDAMTYHLPRVMHWAQQGSVSHYRTNILRQLYLNPGAEFLMLHLYCLGGTDRFANLLQWLAMIGTAAGVSLIARHLGAKSAGQAAATLLVMTLPMGILQATSTQNDYVVTFWLVVAVWLTLRAGHAPTNTRFVVPAFGAAMGLAMLTKATAYLFGAPLGVWFFLRVWKAHGAGVARPLATAGTILLALNLGHAVRNGRLFGSILGPTAEVAEYQNESLSAAILASNFIRNLAIHANVYPLSISAPLTDVLTSIHDRLGVSAFDPRTTRSEGYLVSDQHSHEDYAGCGFHLLLILMWLSMAIARPGRENTPCRAYALCVLASAIFFCSYLKWQPWHVRLHLPLLVLGLAPVGRIVDRAGSARTIGMGLCGLVTLLAIYPILFNELRPLVDEGNVFTTDRVAQRFAGRKDRRYGFESAVAHVRSQPCTIVGLAWGEDDWEYPLWVMLNGTQSGPYRFVHWDVNNASAAAPSSLRDQYKTECVSVLEGEGRRKQEVTVRNATGG